MSRKIARLTDIVGSSFTRAPSPRAFLKCIRNVGFFCGERAQAMPARSRSPIRAASRSGLVAAPNPVGHGHNDVPEVTTGGDPDPEAGMIADHTWVKVMMDRYVIDGYSSGPPRRAAPVAACAAGPVRAFTMARLGEF